MESHYHIKTYDVPGTNGLVKVKMLYMNNFPVTHEEDVAMMCALLSRSRAPIEKHVEKLNAKGSESFMKQFYIGYGHKSIGLCGNCVVFVEGCSMVAAKACQAHQKYAGQEISTRFNDMADQLFHLFGEDGGVKRYLTNYVNDLRTFYKKAVIDTEKEQALKLGIDMETATLEQKTTVKTRAFDIVRGFLPLGCSTNVAICLTLADMADHVQWMYSHHTFPEVRNLARTIHIALKERHPNTFLTELQETPISVYSPSFKEKGVEWENIHNCVYPESADQSWDVRGPKVTITKRIDYACYRDLQRHTSVKRSMVRFKIRKFERFYIENLPLHLQDQAAELVYSLRAFDVDNKGSPVWDDINTHNLLMYAMPMGFKVNYSFFATNSALAYIFPLRSGPTVHPVLRKYICEIYNELDSKFKARGWEKNPYRIQEEQTQPNFKRGTQTITEK